MESPLEFQSLPKFVRKDFLLSGEEARGFLALPLPVGMPMNDYVVVNLRGNLTGEPTMLSGNDNGYHFSPLC